MKKTITKILALVMALMLSVACAVSASAASNDLTIGRVVIPAATQESIQKAAQDNPIAFPVEEAISVAAGASSFVSGLGMSAMIFGSEFSNQLASNQPSVN